MGYFFKTQPNPQKSSTDPTQPIIDTWYGILGYTENFTQQRRCSRCTRRSSILDKTVTVALHSAYDDVCSATVSQLPLRSVCRLNYAYCSQTLRLKCMQLKNWARKSSQFSTGKLLGVGLSYIIGLKLKSRLSSVNRIQSVTHVNLRTLDRQRTKSRMHNHAAWLQ